MHDQASLNLSSGKARLIVFGLAWLSGVASVAAAAALPSVTPSTFRDRVVSPHRGRVLAVNFWATWCVPCREEMPDLIAAGRKLSANGLDVVLVSADFATSTPAVERFLRGVKSPFVSFLEQSEDPQTFIDAVDPNWGGELPHTVVYSRQGALRLSLTSRQSAASFERAFRNVLQER